MKKVYQNEMRNGASLYELDRMDIHFFWELLEELTIEEVEEVIEFADNIHWL